MTIIPAILPKTRDELISKLSLLRDAGFTGRVQIDMCDGNFVDSKTWPFTNESGSAISSFELIQIIKDDTELQGLLCSSFKVDLDLMVSGAESKMLLWDAFIPDRLIFHLDSLNDIETASLVFAPDHGMFDVINRKAIVFACSLDTDIESFAYWYDNFNMRSIQVMGIDYVGHQGQEFSDRAVDYIESLRARYPDISIMVDGGVSLETINRLHQVGVAEVVVGSAMFKNNDISKNLEELAARAIL